MSDESMVAASRDARSPEPEHAPRWLSRALVALLIVALAENARIPVDNPATHLELTMVHEAMVLEYSGRHLAMIELASQLKLLQSRSCSRWSNSMAFCVTTTNSSPTGTQRWR